MNTYTPGVCNIGPAEIRQRTQSAIIAFVSTVIVAVLLLVTHAPIHWRLVIFLPATATAVTYFQVRLHFCVGFAMSGLFNMDEEAGKAETVTKAEFRSLDQRKARQIILNSVLIGFIVTGLILIV